MEDYIINVGKVEEMQMIKDIPALDELFQLEQWGEDAEAAQRRANIAADIALAERFIRLARTE